MTKRYLNGYPVNLSDEELKEFDALLHPTGYTYHLSKDEHPLCGRPLSAEKVKNPLFSDEEAQFKNRDEPNFCSECLAQIAWGGGA